MDVSVNKAAEYKYHNVRLWPLRKVGQECQEKPCQRKKGLLGSKRFGSRNQDRFEYNSIPSLCFLPSSQNLVTSEFATPNFPNCRIHILDKKGRLVHSFPTEVEKRGSSTFGICAAAEDDSGIAVCIGNGLGIWNTEGKMVTKMTEKEVENCCHVTKMKNGLLAATCITEMKGRCVTLWDPKAGKVVGQFGSRPEVVEKNPLKATHKVIIRNNDICLPWFLTSNSRDEIFISDRNAKCIKMFDARNGSYIKSFDIHGIDTRCRRTLTPQGLCADEDDNIIVVDNNKKSLFIFDRYGEFVASLGSAKDGVIDGEPWAISMTTTPIKKLCMSNNDNSRMFAVSTATPDPIVGIYKLSVCPHYTNFV